MGYESIFYKNSHYDSDKEVISWVQQFMKIYFSEFEHPDWFKKEMESISWNIDVPYGKSMFHEEVINGDIEKFDYCIRMIDLALEKMETFTKRFFFKYIENDLKGRWCEMNDLNSSGGSYEAWLDDNEDLYDSTCKDVLRNLKRIMLENAPN
jgi:hypothetical protein